MSNKPTTQEIAEHLLKIRSYINKPMAYNEVTELLITYAKLPIILTISITDFDFEYESEEQRQEIERILNLKAFL